MYTDVRNVCSLLSSMLGNPYHIMGIAYQLYQTHSVIHNLAPFNIDKTFWVSISGLMGVLYTCLHWYLESPEISRCCCSWRRIRSTVNYAWLIMPSTFIPSLDYHCGCWFSDWENKRNCKKDKEFSCFQLYPMEFSCFQLYPMLSQFCY